VTPSVFSTNLFSEKEIPMRYQLLGNSGLRVSEAALGTMTFGDDWGWGSAKDEAKKVYDAFREAGGNFIDTANFYTKGTSESFLGEFMKGHRRSVVLATKYSNAAPGTDPNAAGNHAGQRSTLQGVSRIALEHADPATPAHCGTREVPAVDGRSAARTRATLSAAFLAGVE
jgi:aryl-alcohol dehydrogenase-like predicted oxidoreductase